LRSRPLGDHLGGLISAGSHVGVTPLSRSRVGREIAKKLATKISKLRIFKDSEGKMNLSVLDTSGSALVVSQFTLYANSKKGNRPSYTDAASAILADSLYMSFSSYLKKLGMKVENGIFGANMQVKLLNDGPVTIILDSKELGF